MNFAAARCSGGTTAGAPASRGATKRCMEGKGSITIAVIGKRGKT